MSDVGVSVEPGMGSPSRLLSVIRANEVAQAAIAKAMEAAAVAGPAGAQGQSGEGGAKNSCGQSPPPPTQAKKGQSNQSG